MQGTTSTTRASKKAWCVYVFFMLHYFTHGLWIITSGVRALKNASSLSCIYSCPGEAREPWKHGREDSGGGRAEKGGPNGLEGRHVSSKSPSRVQDWEEWKTKGVPQIGVKSMIVYPFTLPNTWMLAPSLGDYQGYIMTKGTSLDFEFAALWI